MKQTQIIDERIFSKIYLIRGQKVMIDEDLAELYQIENKVLKQAVKRNIDRFPLDFMFELTAEEMKSQRSQFVTFEKKRGKGQYSKYLPYAFTEQGVAMLSSVLRSKRAVEVNIGIMRIFVKMRQMISGYKELLEKVEKMEAIQLDNKSDIENIYSIIKELLEPIITKRKPIGFIK
ncbi:MAG: ORF6N domain-containing protein [Bacteroidota bacterium]